MRSLRPYLYPGVLLFLFLRSAAFAQEHPKVDAKVWEDTAGNNVAPFLVILVPQTNDWKSIEHVEDRKTKGRIVLSTLQERAIHSQAPLRAFLDNERAHFGSYWIVNMLVVYGKRALVEKLAQRGDVAFIESDRPFRATLEVSSGMNVAAPASPVEWGVTKIGASDLLQRGITGTNIIYANADTGVEWTHPALLQHYLGWNGTTADHNYHWWDAIHSDISGNGSNPRGFNSRSPVDDTGHGSHTTGTAVGGDSSNQIGVAPGAKWIACRNMDEGVGRPSTYIECLQFFLAPTDLDGNNPDPDRRPDCVSNSYGCPADELCAPNSLHIALQNLRAAGTFMAVSAGNAGPSCGTINDPPALDSASFTVAATDQTDNVASFSSRGPVTVDGSNRPKPELAAPGVSVRSAYTNGSYRLLNGTSMSSPHVAGAVALLWSALPHFRGKIDATESLLERTARPLTAAQFCGTNLPGQIPNNIYGYGRLDIFAAWQKADYDSDGMPDYWELQYGLSPTNSADSALDLDGDGMSNVAEYFAGTDPSRRESVLKLTRIAKTPNGYDIIEWPSIGGKQYRIQYQDSSYSPSNFLDLIRPLEIDLAPGGVTSIGAFTNSFTLTPPPSRQRYYRIKLVE